MTRKMTVVGTAAFGDSIGDRADQHVGAEQDTGEGARQGRARQGCARESRACQGGARQGPAPAKSQRRRSPCAG